MAEARAVSTPPVADAATVASSAKVLLSVDRSMLKPSSFAALSTQPNVIWLDEVAVAVNPLGAGGTVGGATAGHVSVTGPTQSAALRKAGSCSMCRNRPV